MLSVINISLLDQGQEGVAQQKNLTLLPTKAGTTLAKAPRPAGNSLPNYPLPPLFRSLFSKQGPLRGGGRLKPKWITKEPGVLLLLPLTEPVFLPSEVG